MLMAIATSKEKYAGKMTADKLEIFIRDNFNCVVLRTEMNSLWNQFLVVYADNEPAGYAKLTTGGKEREIFNQKTVARIEAFDVLEKFNEQEIKKSLLEKCLSACSMQQVILFCEIEGNVDNKLFETYGFRKYPGLTGSVELGIETCCLVREKDPSL